MSVNIMISCLIFIVWFYILTVFKRTGQEFFFFILGSVGTFLFLFVYFVPFLQVPVIQLDTYLAGLVGRATNTFTVGVDEGVITMIYQGLPKNMYMDMECSAILEIITFFSMICFYPAYRLVERMMLCVGGIAWIIFSNVVRLAVIGILVNKEVVSFYMAHAIIGRIVFYVLIILAYFYIFTKRQIVKQKVGEFNYD